MGSNFEPGVASVRSAKEIKIKRLRVVLKTLKFVFTVRPLPFPLDLNAAQDQRLHVKVHLFGLLHKKRHFDESKMLTLEFVGAD